MAGYIGKSQSVVLTNIEDDSVTTAKIVDGAVTAAKLASGAAVPDQTGHAGQFLTTDGTTADWAAVNSGAGYYLGENGATGDTTNGLGDIFRVHENVLDADVTIATNTNASCTGPITFNGTVTVNGTLTVV